MLESTNFIIANNSSPYCRNLLSILFFSHYLRVGSNFEQGFIKMIFKNRKGGTPRHPCGLVVRIPGSHPGGPGSIPGVGTFGSMV